MDITKTDVWRRLAEHRKQMDGVTMREQFASDPERFDRFSLRLGDLRLDFAKNRITADTMVLFRELAGAAGVEALRDQMFAGAPINVTERRAVLHVALRNRSDRAIAVDGRDVMPDVRDALTHIQSFSDAVRTGQ